MDAEPTEAEIGHCIEYSLDTSYTYIVDSYGTFRHGVDCCDLLTWDFCDGSLVDVDVGTEAWSEFVHFGSKASPGRST